MKAIGARVGLGVGFLLLVASTGSAQVLSAPRRPSDAMTGSEFVEVIRSMPREEREENIFDQVALGNIPDFIRTLCPVTMTEFVGGRNRTAVYYVTPEYLAIGSDADYFLTPMTPMLAQRVADFLGCGLPTRKMVNDIYAQAAVKLAPAPIPPSEAMTTVPVFDQHNTMVRQQRAETLGEHPLGALVGGHKKDVVITPALATSPGKVAIYGWHQLSGVPIQPLYLGHTDEWADYSHGIRLVQGSLKVDGQWTLLSDVLADANLAGLLSDEGTVICARYPVPLQLPMEDRFPAEGRALVQWQDRFTRSGVKAFLPAAPGDGDGYVLVVQDLRGGVDTTRLGHRTDADYSVQCDLYCDYRPQLAADGFERIGIFLYDDGNGLFEGASSGGIQGNNYAMTWDSRDGRLSCFRTVGGVPTDLNPSPRYYPSSGWRTFRIEGEGACLTFKLGGEVILSATDTTFGAGQCGIGYHEYFTTNANIRGTRADHFRVERPGQGPQPTSPSWNVR